MSKPLTTVITVTYKGFVSEKNVCCVFFVVIVFFFYPDFENPCDR